MTEATVQVRCPACHATFPAEGEWRLAKCPGCGEVVMRMTDDTAYD